MLELGQHFLVEFIGCDASIIDDEIRLRDDVLRAVALSGAHIIKDVFHKFAPQGVTGIVVIAESHVAIHSWPEHQYLACDVFSCSRRMDVQALISDLQASIKATEVIVQEIARGPKSPRIVLATPYGKPVSSI
jgi:S-adenosylmethionine decarboxylase